MLRHLLATPMRFLWLLPLLVLGCEPPPAAFRPPAAVADTARLDLAALAEAHLGGTDLLRRLPSPDGQYLLLVRQPPETPLLPDPPLSYALVDRRTGRVTARETDLHAHVRWDGPHLLGVRLVQGTVQADPNGRIDAPPARPAGHYWIDAATGRRG